MDIADFIQARIAEDEAKAATSNFREQELQNAAKRREQLGKVLEWRREPFEGLRDGDILLMLQTLAAKYADHPDYQPAWQPPE